MDNYADWRDELHKLAHLRADRCILLRGKCAQLQIYVFVDASHLAYAACVYSTAVNEEGYIEVNLLSAKVKVAPVLKISMQRLELPATMGAKQSRTR